ncbi:inactive tyrosine-protein kinase PEAK1 isoform X2 [Oncorhynchus nerka]|uniref:inactive tyrosine-protein kinase PEAK1 isoform X2 n=1 Tax=Oncorhynchus nerka TaxID=8023 RepID=UPI00112FF964|nr:inactive tyrosine-protein kinase PEAK1-like [Oncorhynchus nerka]
MDCAAMDCATQGAERQSGPPVLPIKQRRSLYSRGSSMGSSVDLELDGSVSSPLGPHQHQGSTCTDVFSAATDCHALQCPIHQRYDPSYCHQERFFSDSTTPPPVPKKRLARTLSLPGVYLCPLSPLPCSHQNYDNPLYMLVPIAGTQPHVEIDEERPVQKSPLNLQPLSQLDFDTPDEQLTYFFSSFYNQGDICQGIQHRHLLFLRSMEQRIEAGVLLMRVSGEGVFAFQPQDFLLCENYQPKQIAGSLYYSLHSPKIPGRIIAAKVSSEVGPLSQPTSVPPNVNIQQVIVSFPSCPALEKEPGTKNTTTSDSSQSDQTGTESPDESRIEADQSQAESEESSGPTVASLLLKGYAVTIERDLPQATLEDFVQEGRFLRSFKPLVYERQLSILLLQLALGLQHLCSNAATCAELKAQGILLVWPRERETEADKAEESGRSEEIELLENEKEKIKGEIQELWRKWGTPRVALTNHTSHSDPSLFQPAHAPPSIQSQFGVLLEYCLYLSDNAPSQHTQSSDGAIQSSPYLPGLLQLASWLQDEGSGLQIADVVGVLQALLWGPRVELFRVNPPVPSTLHNWLSVKQALLMLKLAEGGLIQDLPSLDWEHCLCLQYISFTDSETVMRATARLGLHNSGQEVVITHVC